MQTTISNLTKMAQSYPNEQKTLWEKEKLLVTSNFSFSHSVFKRLVSQGRQKVSLCGNGLNYSFYILIGNLSFSVRKFNQHEFLSIIFMSPFLFLHQLPPNFINFYQSYSVISILTSCTTDKIAHSKSNLKIL